MPVLTEATVCVAVKPIQALAVKICLSRHWLSHTPTVTRLPIYYKNSTQKAVPGGTETIIQMADDKYAVQVTLHYVAYVKENVIKTWSEIKHNEKSPITLWRYVLF